jgi:predicted lipid-binding transport protein (Tim44 family)
MLGGLAGGLLFRSLFGGSPAYGGAGGGMGCAGIGLFDLLVLGGILYLIYWYMKRKRESAVAGGGYQSSASSAEIPYQATHAPAFDVAPPPTGDWDLEQGLGYIRQQDPYFDAARFQDQCMDTFFKIQGAWANRDMSSVRRLLTEEMYRLLQADVENLKAQRQINRLENIAVRSVDITEAWQESGQDFITVRVYANLLDYTVDEASGQVLAGSQTDPVKFEEYWTFTRPVGNNPWQLSAIQQAPA